MKLANAKQMQNLDNTTINEFGVAGIVLMENAGRSTVVKMNRQFGDLGGKVVSIFVGPGNNGGDGLVIARHLHQQGSFPIVFLLLDPAQFTGDSAANLAVVQKLPIPVHFVLSAADLDSKKKDLADSYLIVDAIFGTGLRRAVTGFFAAVVQMINTLAVNVVAVDIPSGLNSDTGQAAGVCVQADLTVTYALAKPGQVIFPGSQYVGALEVVDIGMPPTVVKQADIRLELLVKDNLLSWLPRRQSTDHKGSFGHLLVLAGSTGKTGAALLCGRGALRSGVGLVTLCVPKDLNVIFEASLLEAMTISLPKSFGCLSVDDYDLIAEGMRGVQAVVVGPGLGVAAATSKLLLRIYQESTLPMVVDADGLNIMAANPAVLSNPGALRLLTPHPGEMARLMGVTVREVQMDRLAAASFLAKKNNVYVVLKGAGTVIAAPDGHLAINSTGNPGMAAGGMGDVLAGVIGALLAQGLSGWQAACLGVYVHGLAGDMLALDTACGFGYLADELAGKLPCAFVEIA